MTLFRFGLESLECRVPRSADPYTDQLSIGLVASRNGVVIASKDSPYGNGKGSRAELNFGRDTIRNLAPTFWGDGTDVVWDVEFTLEPGDEPVDVSVVVNNIRNVGDPYLVSRVLIHLAAAAAGVGAAKEFGPAIVEAARWVLSDKDRRNALEDAIGLDIATPLDVALPDWLFDWSWPGCAGDVLTWTRRFTYEEARNELGAMRIDTHSELAVKPRNLERGCRDPVYIAHAHLTLGTAFGEKPTPTSRIYVPVTSMKADLWEGEWRRMSGNECRSLIRRGVDRHYPVSAREHCQELEIFALDASVRESLSEWMHYSGDVEATRSYAGSVSQDAGSMAQATIAGAVAAEAVGSMSTGSYAGSVGTTIGGSGGSTLNWGASAVEEEAPTGNVPSQTPSQDLVGEDTSLQAFSQRVRTLQLSPDVRLGLYRCVETFADREPRETGPYVRYVRNASVSTTRADYMLVNAPDLR